MAKIKQPSTNNAHVFLRTFAQASLSTSLSFWLQKPYFMRKTVYIYQFCLNFGHDFFLYFHNLNIFIIRLNYIVFGFGFGFNVHIYGHEHCFGVF